MESLAEFFLANFGAHANEPAFGQRRGYRMEWFTYGQVLEMAIEFGRELESRGIAKGDRVMLWGANSAEWVAAFFGCTMRGVVVVPMDDAALNEFAHRVGHQVEAKLWICSREHLNHRLAGTVPVIAFEDITVPSSRKSSEKWGAQTEPPEVPGDSRVVITRDDILQIVFTSGTTADPKGVVITHGNVLANIEPIEREMKPYIKYERWVHPVRFLNLMPLSHVFGQFLGMFLPPILGGVVIFQNEFKPSEIIDSIRRERVSVLVTVPRVLQSLKQKIERDLEERGKKADFRRRFREAEGKHFLRRWWIHRSIRRQFGWKFWAFICGGAALDSATEEFWDRLGYAAIQGYGLTETTSLISVNHPFRLGKRSIGKVLAGRTVKLAEDGEILVGGGGVAAGYWNRTGPQQAADEEGWYHTGDIGSVDENGNLYFKGRKKEVIVTPSGLNIYPEDLESALRKQPEIRDCVVVPIDRGENAEPCAVLILKDGADADLAVDRANQELADFQRLRLWIEWPERDFPRTSTQKAKRNEIGAFAKAKILGRDKEGALANPLDELVAKIAKRRDSTREISRDTDLSTDLGLSSLDRVELIGALEDRYQVDLGDTRFGEARTIGDIEKMLLGGARQRVEYHYPAWALRWPITWIRWLAQHLLMIPAMLVLGWPKVEGRENLRGQVRPLLVICNHITDVDLGFVQVALPPRYRSHLATATGGEALEKLRSPGTSGNLFGRIYDRVQWALGVSLLNLFPLPREAGFRKSFEYAGRAADRGYSILVFPEGRHTTDGKMNPFRAGIGLLANNLKIPVLPIRIHGLFEVKQAGKRFAPPFTIRVRIGKPMTFGEGARPEDIARELQAAVEDL